MRGAGTLGWSAQISSFHTYELGEGRTHTGSVNTAFQLLDVTDEDGGFVVRAHAYAPRCVRCVYN